MCMGEKMVDGSVEDTKSKAILDCFWKLTDENADVRLSAVEKLLSQVPASDAESLAYVNKRLFRGLASTRGCSRLGFSCALSALLQRDGSTFNWDLFVESLPLNREDAKANAFGRALAMIALSRVHHLCDAQCMQRVQECVTAMRKLSAKFGGLQLLLFTAIGNFGAHLDRKTFRSTFEDFLTPIFSDTDNLTPNAAWLLLELQDTQRKFVDKFSDSLSFVYGNLDNFLLKSVDASPTLHPLVGKLLAKNSEHRSLMKSSITNVFLKSDDSRLHNFGLKLAAQIVAQTPPDQKKLEHLLHKKFIEELMKLTVSQKFGPFLKPSIEAFGQALSTLVERFSAEDQGKFCAGFLTKHPQFDRIIDCPLIANCLRSLKPEAVSSFLDCFFANIGRISTQSDFSFALSALFGIFRRATEDVEKLRVLGFFVLLANCDQAPVGDDFPNLSSVPEAWYADADKKKKSLQMLDKCLQGFMEKRHTANPDKTFELSEKGVATVNGFLAFLAENLKKFGSVPKDVRKPWTRAYRLLAAEPEKVAPIWPIFAHILSTAIFRDSQTYAPVLRDLTSCFEHYSAANGVIDISEPGDEPGWFEAFCDISLNLISSAGHNYCRGPIQVTFYRLLPKLEHFEAFKPIADALKIEKIEDEISSQFEVEDKTEKVPNGNLESGSESDAEPEDDKINSELSAAFKTFTAAKSAQKEGKSQVVAFKVRVLDFAEVLVQSPTIFGKVELFEPFLQLLLNSCVLALNDRVYVAFYNRCVDLVNKLAKNRHKDTKISLDHEQVANLFDHFYEFARKVPAISLPVHAAIGKLVATIFWYIERLPLDQSSEMKKVVSARLKEKMAPILHPGEKCSTEVIPTQFLTACFQREPLEHLDTFLALAKALRSEHLSVFQKTELCKLISAFLVQKSQFSSAMNPDSEQSGHVSKIWTKFLKRFGAIFVAHFQATEKHPRLFAQLLQILLEVAKQPNWVPKGVLTDNLELEQICVELREAKVWRLAEWERVGQAISRLLKSAAYRVFCVIAKQLHFKAAENGDLPPDAGELPAEPKKKKAKVNSESPC